MIGAASLLILLEEGTYASGLEDHVDKALVQERLIELSELQDSITSIKRDSLIAQDIEVLIDEVGFAKVSFRKHPKLMES